MVVCLSLNGREHNIAVDYKEMKYARLKVFPSGDIKLSVPYNTSEKWIAEFLEKKQNWIEKKLDLFLTTQSVEKEESVVSGSSTRILGRQLTVRIVLSAKKAIVVDDLFVTVFTTETEQPAIDKQFGNWWQKAAKQYYQSVLEKLYPIVSKHGVPMPSIFVGKMNTLWGSCSRRFSKINLNYYLFKANAPCIEYVILHELTHFLYPKHDRNFFEFMTIHMPDWQERRKQLDYEFVLGM